MKGSSSRKPRIIITNIVSLNPGDAAILWGMLRILKKKYGDSADITVFDKKAEIARTLYPWANFRQAIFPGNSEGVIAHTLSRKGYGHWNLRIRYKMFCIALWLMKHSIGLASALFLKKADRDSLRLYLTADVIISTGGTYLTENYGLLPAIYDYRLSLATGKPLVFFTQTLGPFRNVNNQRHFRTIFHRAYAILLRDEKSHKHIIELGVSGNNIKLAKDAAFVMESTNASGKPNYPSRRDNLHIAISVRSMRFFNHEKQPMGCSYEEFIAHLIKTLVEKFSANVTFLSTCQGIPDYWTDDSQTASAIAETLPEHIRRRIAVDSSFRQPQQVADVYGTYDLVIATRMHAAILAMAAGTPTVAIAYEFKIEELYQQLGLADLMIPIRDLNQTKGVEILDLAIDKLAWWKEKTIGQMDNVRAEAWGVLEALPDIPGHPDNTAIQR